MSIQRRALMAAATLTFSAVASSALAQQETAAASSFSMEISGKITAACGLGRGATVDFGNIAAGGNTAGGKLAFTCNVPFDLSIVSTHGGLAHTKQPKGQGPYVGQIDYTMGISVPVLSPDPSIIKASYTGAELVGGRTLSSGDAIAAGGADISFALGRPGGEGLLAGSYSEVIELTVQPR